ncbi:MAG: Na+/H+ antiporter NhaA [Myxococcales bacterium]|jgi:NhaA family Na+:H+ antiporter
MTLQRTRQPLALPRPIALALRPFQKFLQTESASGILLLVATGVALVWANSRFGDSYRHLLEQTISISGFGVGLSWPLHMWINDALMAAFFFLVGMEIKRELVLGELNSLRRAILPAFAALGGMLMPALIFVAFNAGTESLRGWGVPVATDIAFALGALALLKGRVPASLAVFLTALAIFDDLGAIVVIALFYGQAVNVAALLAAVGITLLLVLMNLFGVRGLWPYLAMGMLLWIAVLNSGIHATIAGVVLGLCIPSRTRRDPAEVDVLLDRLRTVNADAQNERFREETLSAVEGYLADTLAPLDRLVRALHPWVAFLIIPVFALANAGVELAGLSPGDLVSPLTLGIALGLFLGKQAGIFGATWLAVKLRLSPRPSRASWSQVYGVAMLGGIGFTMSLFISALAFPADGLLNEKAKVGILLGSALSATVGMLFLRFAARPGDK